MGGEGQLKLCHTAECALLAALPGHWRPRASQIWTPRLLPASPPELSPPPLSRRYAVRVLPWLAPCACPTSHTTLHQGWAGETADHSGGGIPGLTDTFRSCLYYAWQLGALPAAGVPLAARQCLSGGDYELLQRVGFAPNPDFWVAWL